LIHLSKVPEEADRWGLSAADLLSEDEISDVQNVDFNIVPFTESHEETLLKLGAARSQFHEERLEGLASKPGSTA